MRAMNLANALVSREHQVTLWSSAFYHQEKRHRTHQYQQIKVNELLDIRLIPSRGYEGNIGLGRLIDHAELALNLRKLLKREQTVPDVAFVGYPPIEFAYVALKWMKAHGVPTLLDVKDQWPHIFIEPFPWWLRPFAKFAFYPYFYVGRKTLREATAFCTMAQGFLDWMSRFSGRPLSSLDCIAPLSSVPQNLTDECVNDAVAWWKTHGVIDDGRKRFFFVGSFSQAFDFLPVAKAARQAYDTGLDWQFVICGDGAKAEYLSELFSGLSNVVLPGWADRPKVEALACMSLVGLAPYRNTPDFINSVPNKVIDYLSLGKPIASPLEGEVAALIKHHHVGLAYGQSSTGGLFDQLMRACHDETNMKQISENASILYDTHFSGEKVYKSLAEKLESLSKVVIQ